MLRLAFPLTFFIAGAILSGCGEAEAGDDGDGGAGGSEGATGVGTGRGSSTGTSGNSSAATGGQGGADSCVGPEGNGLSVNACEMTNVGSLGTCPGTDTEPLALQVCRSKFGYLTQGSWENLLSCLGKLPATYDEACSDTSASDAIEACLSDVVREACPNPAADAMCESIAATCESMGAEFTLEACSKSLAPLSEASIASYEACTDDAISSGTFMCRQLHGDCLGQIGVAP